MSIRPRRSLLNPALQRPSALQSVPRNPDQLWLDKNENLDPVLGALCHKVLAGLSPRAIATYPEAGEAYRKLARWVNVSPDSLMLTAGSDGAIRLTFEAFVEHGDPVVHTAPTFAMYPVYSKMFGASVTALEYARGAQGPELDSSALIEAVLSAKPKLTCLPNPDSPTGTVMAPENLRRLLEACESVGSVLLIDEAYHPFYDRSVAEWTQSSRNLIVARTFAKAWGAAGIRVGYAVGHPETIAFLHKMRPMYEVSTLAVDFVTALLDNADAIMAAVGRINDGKMFFVERMRALGFEVLPTAANFAHVAFGDHGPAIHAALAGKVYYRTAFSELCLAGFSRFTTAPRSIMAQLVGLIDDVVAR
jgi:histidinol-phosphate aminotransferase